MTEYWVSQGNKWCDFCKIFIANNPASIRNHELGQRHKDNVAKRLNSMRQEKAAKDKEEKEAIRALEQIEAKAQRSYKKDVAAFQEARKSNVQALVAQDDSQVAAKGVISGEWEHDSSSGYYYNESNGCYYDPNSGFYYTDVIGKWVTQEEAFAAVQVSGKSTKKMSVHSKLLSVSDAQPSSDNRSSSASQSGPPPGRVVSAAPNPMRAVKGAPSALSLNKRKRQDQKPKALSEEETAALKAREAARKRVEEREKPLLGLYRR